MRREREQTGRGQVIKIALASLILFALNTLSLSAQQDGTCIRLVVLR